MKYSVEILISLTVVVGGCSGPTEEGGPASNPPPAAASSPATKPPSAAPKITIERPADGAKFKLGEPIVCVGSVEFPAGMSVGYNIVLIENGILRAGKVAIMFSTSVPLERTGARYAFKTTLEGGKLPQRPGKYAMRAVLIEKEPPEEGDRLVRSHNLVSKITHYEVEP